jgi:hypothetical protein
MYALGVASHVFVFITVLRTSSLYRIYRYTRMCSRVRTRCAHQKTKPIQQLNVFGVGTDQLYSGTCKFFFVLQTEFLVTLHTDRSDRARDFEPRIPCQIYRVDS